MDRPVREQLDAWIVASAVVTELEPASVGLTRAPPAHLIPQRRPRQKRHNPPFETMICIGAVPHRYGVELEQDSSGTRKRDLTRGPPTTDPCVGAN
jgi:hypothetical protein